MKTPEIIEKIEQTINATSETGLLVGTLAARLESARQYAEDYSATLLALYESTGDDLRASALRESRARMLSVLT
jgi:2-keto-3-deoxy-L-rhamnonate aldolase RhmA